MLSALNILLLFAAYIVGSIPSAVWIGKNFYNTDVREYGSGNAGATNVFRVLGKKAGIIVLMMDVLKGFLAVCLAYLSHYQKGSNSLTDLQLVLGIASLVGHIFPLFAQFRGGKGIATLLGIILAVHLYAGLISMGVFILILLISSYVSVASITASILFPVVVLIIDKSFEHSKLEITLIPMLTRPLIIFSILIPIMVLITHQKNIERLFRRQESKTKLIKKKKVAKTQTQQTNEISTVEKE